MSQEKIQPESHLRKIILIQFFWIIRTELVRSGLNTQISSLLPRNIRIWPKSLLHRDETRVFRSSDGGREMEQERTMPEITASSCALTKVQAAA